MPDKAWPLQNRNEVQEATKETTALHDRYFKPFEPFKAPEGTVQMLDPSARKVQGYQFRIRGQCDGLVLSLQS